MQDDIFKDLADHEIDFILNEIFRDDPVSNNSFYPRLSKMVKDYLKERSRRL